MSGALCGPEDMKSSIDRQTRTSLEHHRQAQDRLGSMDRADDGRRGHKTGMLEMSQTSVSCVSHVCFHELKDCTAVNFNVLVAEDEKSGDYKTYWDSFLGNPSSGCRHNVISTRC